MSISQAIPSVQVISGLSAWHNNGTQPFAQPVPHILVADSQTAWFGETQSPIANRTSMRIQVGGIWLFQETAESLRQAPWSKSPLDIARDAATQGQVDTACPDGCLGEFAYEIGLIPNLLSMPLPQKSVVHTPQGKVLTFLMGILTGITQEGFQRRSSSFGP